MLSFGKLDVILYQTADGKTNIDVKLENEIVWPTSEQMAILFERDRTVIQKHIRNICNEGELYEKDVINPTNSSCSLRG